MIKFVETDKDISSPYIKDSGRTLSVLGTSVTQNPVLKSYAEKDLGLKLELVTLGGLTAQQRAALSPQSYDVYDQWFHDIDLSWPTGSLQPIEISKIKSFDSIDLSALNSYLPLQDESWFPTAPIDRLFVNQDLSLSRQISGEISMLPTIFNADTMALVNPKDDKAFSSSSSWIDLLSEKWTGSVVIQKDWAISVAELLIALIEKKHLKIENIKDLNILEIDTFIAHLNKYMKSGQFIEYWEVEEDLEQMVSKNKTFLCSIWWSGAMKLKSLGHDIRMLTPKEGYRGWCGGLALSKAISGWALDAAYEYLNWWLTGPAGAYICRQGGYFTNITAVQSFLQDHEFEFWINGEAARYDIFDNEGRLLYNSTQKREGGSLYERMNRIAIWNTVMPEHNYLVRKWETLPWNYR